MNTDSISGMSSIFCAKSSGKKLLPTSSKKTSLAPPDAITRSAGSTFPSASSTPVARFCLDSDPLDLRTAGDLAASRLDLPDHHSHQGVTAPDDVPVARLRNSPGGEIESSLEGRFGVDGGNPQTRELAGANHEVREQGQEDRLELVVVEEMVRHPRGAPVPLRQQGQQRGEQLQPQ